MAALCNSIPSLAQQFFLSKDLSVRETSYAYAGWRFAEHFLNRLGPEYPLLKEILEASKDDRCVPTQAIFPLAMRCKLYSCFRDANRHGSSLMQRRPHAWK